MKEIILNVDGMMCEGCENRIKNALETIKQVKQVTANHKTGIVKITTKENIEQKAVEEKIEDLGFTVKK